ncbi:MAG TPA: hypothetical protein VND94_21790 [Terriglobia bacterium]|nr:hypothetical protein [Terriglobia bacterium]
MVDDDLVDDELDSCLPCVDARFSKLAADQLDQRPDLGGARIGKCWRCSGSRLQKTLSGSLAPGLSLGEMALQVLVLSREQPE